MGLNFILIINTHICKYEFGYNSTFVNTMITDIPRGILTEYLGNLWHIIL